MFGAKQTKTQQVEKVTEVFPKYIRAHLSTSSEPLLLRSNKKKLNVITYSTSRFRDIDAIKAIILAKSGHDTFYESFNITEISPTSHKRLAHTIDCAKKNIFIVNTVCGPRTRAPPRLLDEASKRKGTLCTEHCPLCEGQTGGIFFFPEQARSQLALCCLPVTRVGPPQAKAPTKILRGADGLKT